MEDPVTHEPHTAHTLNRVPVVLVNGHGADVRLRDGRLADIAPTILALMGLPQPKEMSGRSLMAPAAARTVETGREQRAIL
jgi:2,3-bisphosphoglycerate-independent phosphoglycerate mutase